MKRKFLGSSVALVLGILLLFAIFAPLDKSSNSTGAFFIGLIIIIGALSYKSTKKRTLGLVKDTKIRTSLEVAVLIITLLLAFLNKNNLLFDYIALVWIISGYLIATRKTIPSNIKQGKQL